MPQPTALALPVEPKPGRPAVRGQSRRDTAGWHALVAEFALPDEAEPAPVFAA